MRRERWCCGRRNNACCVARSGGVVGKTSGEGTCSSTMTSVRNNVMKSKMRWWRCLHGLRGLGGVGAVDSWGTTVGLAPRGFNEVWGRYAPVTAADWSKIGLKV
ncbi:hypothetical protein FK873_gp160 [Micromonas pusilla virus SP1]|uniref:Uncharacterized protein n=1 Tax=Micromonas pusilla virus SP1 TaxID=373996 RepID=G9E6F1_MPSP1|nr:hypothetical protein FK873_gp160 [Micromonas pusilla virus SP1]AET84978.1 hypothetical protein MPXG_00180 [Micromonas pusilla virus SP1]